MSSDNDDASVTSVVGGRPPTSWRMADQYFRDGDVAIDTKPWNDGYVMNITVDRLTRRVFFDPAGRITHLLTLR